MALSSKQLRYVEYLLSLPASERNTAQARTAAAKAAGYAEGSARVQAAKLSKSNKVMAALAESDERVARPTCAKKAKKMGTNVANRQRGRGLPRPLYRPPKYDPDNDLPARHQRFCMEFLVDENATQAYLRVYPNSSYDAAAVSAHDLLRNPKILRRIEELRAERNRRLGITIDRVLSVLARQAFYDPRSLFDADGRLKPLDELDPDDAFAIAGFSTKATVTGEDHDGICTVTNVKLPDKIRAAELLGRHLKLFTDKIEVTEDSEFAKRLAAAVKAQREARRDKK